ncbi:glycosyltransferase [Candidatus Saccharibacteria bacterium]|nr:glycosyltransferase [Candidatus Saccharibacteria bacterium]
MKKILVIGMSNSIGGTETYFYNYYKKIDSSKYHFDFVAAWGTVAFCNEYEKNDSKVYNLPNFMKNPIGYYRKMRRIIRDNKYDVVHINMLSAANVLPIKAALKEKVPEIIVHSHNTNMPKGLVRKVLHRVNKNILARPELIRLACGEAAGRWLFGDDSNFVVLNNAIDLGKFEFDLNNRAEIRKKYNIDKNDFLMGNVGRISEQKNQIFLLEVLKRMESKNVKLMIVGDGDKKNALMDKVKAYELEDKVIIVSPTLEIEKYYSAFDIFVLPSKFEGLPVVLVEAGANGLKAIISDKVLDYPDKNNTEVLALDELDLWVNQIKNGTAKRNPVYLPGYDIETEYKKLTDIYDGAKK